MADNITYAEMTLTTGKGQEKTNTAHLQEETLGVTYAAVKKLPGKKKTSPRQKGGEDTTVTYAALRGIAPAGSRTSEGDQEGPFEESACVIVRGDPEPTDWKRRLYRGRYGHVILETFLVALCLVLLLLITTGVSCPRNSSRPGYILGQRSTAASSSPCQDPWILITNKCYYFSEGIKTRRESGEDCENRGSRLATVKEGTILKLVAITEQKFWIGLEHLGSHHGGTWSGKWADGSTVNITEGTGTCAKIKSKLSLHNCLEDLHWICEQDVPAP